MYRDDDALVCNICFAPLSTFYEVVVSKLYTSINGEIVTFFEGGSIDVCEECMRKFFKTLLNYTEGKHEADC